MPDQRETDPDEALMRAHDLEGVLMHAEGRRHAGLRREAMVELESLEQVLVRAGYARGYLAPDMLLTGRGKRRLGSLVNDEANIARVAAGFDAYQRNGERGQEDAAYGWALAQVQDWEMNEDLDFCWRLILELCAHTEDEWVMVMIAAGPLWSLLDRFADQVLDLIEPEIARGNRKALFVLGCVRMDSRPFRQRIDRVLASYGQERM